MLLLALAAPLVLLGTMLGMHGVERWLEREPAPSPPERAAPAVLALPRQVARVEADRDAAGSVTA